MSSGVPVVGRYVRDQDEALAFHVDKPGFPDPSGKGWKMIEAAR